MLKDAIGRATTCGEAMILRETAIAEYRIHD
jgi:hypothetical protein